MASAPDESSLLALLKAFVLFNMLFSLLFRLAGVSTSDLVVVLLVVNLQILIGGSIWSTLCSRDSLDITEFFGMGGAIGFGLSLLSSQLFRSLIPFSISWLLLPILFLVVSQRRSHYSLIFSLTKIKDSRDLWLIFSGTLIALSTSWYWLISTAVAVFLWVVLQFLRDSNRRNTLPNSNWQALWAIGGVSMALRAFYDLSSLTEIRNPLWWNLRFGVIQDPDAVFYESMVNSTKYFGNQGNIFFSGLKFYYHWFSFAWEATLGSFTQLSPFIVTAIVGPTIVLFTVLSLVFTVAKTISFSVFSAPLAMFSVAMMCAGPIPLFRVLHPYSFSFNFGLIFGYALVVALLHGRKLKRIDFVVVIFILSFLIMGSKVSFAPILVIGIFGCFVWGLVCSEYRKAAILLSVASAFAVIIFFTTIYSLSSNSGASYRVSIGEILHQKANLGQGLSFIVVSVTFVAVFIHLMASTTGLMFIRDVSVSDNRLGIVFSIAGGLFGVILGFVIADDYESGAYFIQGGLALLLPISVAALFSNAKLPDKRSRYYFVAAIVVCLQSAFIWPYLYERTWFGLEHYSGNNLAISVPILVAIFFFLLAIPIRRLGIDIELKKFLAILLLVSTAGSYYGNAKTFFDKSVWAAQSVSPEPENVITGSNQYRDLLVWLRDNSDDNDVVATNRYCSTASDVPPRCLAMWSLTSAITGRQMLSEGSWTVNIISGMEVEAEIRRNLIESFVNSPSDESKESLLNYGVRWVVADFAVTKTRSWGDFAIARFTNSAGSILDLERVKN